MLELRSKLGDSVSRPAPFDAWIDMYGGEDFEKEVKDYIAMVDAACQRIKQDAEKSGDDNVAAQNELKEMQRHFNMSCKLEHMFWDQASTMMNWPDIGGM